MPNLDIDTEISNCFVRKQLDTSYFFREPLCIYFLQHINTLLNYQTLSYNFQFKFISPLFNKNSPQMGFL